MLRLHSAKTAVIMLLLVSTFGCTEIIKEILDEHSQKEPNALLKME